MNNLPQTKASPPARITWGLIWSDFLNVINFEKGVFFTIKGLFLRPKETIDDYLYGNRNLHANPLRFLIFSTAIATLLNFYLIIKPSMDDGVLSTTEDGSVFNTGAAFGESVEISFSDENLNETEGQLPASVKEKKKKLTPEQKQLIVQDSMQTLFSWMDKFTFSMVPIFALVTFLFFRKIGYNYTENLVINAFMISITNVIGMVMIFPSYFSPVIGGTILTGLSTIFMLYFMYRVFEVSSFGSFMKLLGAFLLSYFLFFLVMAFFLMYVIFNSMQGVGN